VQVDGPLTAVTLARPERRNAQTPAMWRMLAAVGQGLPEATRVVLLRAEGESFSAGLDRAMLTAEGLPGEPGLAELAALPDASLDGVIAGFQEAFTWWRRPDIVSVAVVAGHAVGAGFQLALACDLRLVSTDARFAMREVGLGLVPDLGGTGHLVEALGYARALELCLTGRWVDADEAVQLGLAQAAVPRAELDAASADLVAALLAAPAGAARATKALLRSARYATMEASLAAERAAQAARLRELAAATRGAETGKR
jgi:enoyl-CoA hydratase/carnithine racemase